MPRRVLVHGGDETLLRTRQLVLRTLDIDVEVVSGNQRLEHVIHQEHFDLLVLCSSLDDRTRQQGLSLARSADPPVKCLVVTSEPAIPSPVGTTVIRGLDGPDRFVTAVRNLIF